MNKKDKTPSSITTPSAQNQRESPDILPGWPGYRTRDKRSGYDPVDTRTEAAHVSGSLIQKLFARQLQIKNTLVLFLSGILGLSLLAPLALAVFEGLNGNLLSLGAWILFLIAGAIGLALLFNVVKNMVKAA